MYVYVYTRIRSTETLYFVCPGVWSQNKYTNKTLYTLPGTCVVRCSSNYTFAQQTIHLLVISFFLMVHRFYCFYQPQTSYIYIFCVYNKIVTNFRFYNNKLCRSLNISIKRVLLSKKRKISYRKFWSRKGK